MLTCLLQEVPDRRPYRYRQSKVKRNVYICHEFCTAVPLAVPYEGSSIALLLGSYCIASPVEMPRNEDDNI